jgi:hypothetical protein
MEIFHLREKQIPVDTLELKGKINISSQLLYDGGQWNQWALYI